MQLRKRSQSRGDGFSFLLPIPRRPVRFAKRFHGHGRGRGRIIGNAWRFRQPRNKRLLLRKIFHGGLECLIGGQPEVLPQGIIVAVDSDRSGRAEEPAKTLVGNEIGAVEVVVSDANVHAHDAVAPGGRGNQRAKFRHDRADVQIEYSILDIIWARRFARAWNFQLEALARSIELILHGGQCLVWIGRCGLLRQGRRCGRVFGGSGSRGFCLNEQER